MKPEIRLPRRYTAESAALISCLVLIAVVVTAAYLAYSRQEASEREIALRRAENMAVLLQAHTRDLLLSVDDVARSVVRRYARDGQKADLSRVVDEYRDVADYITLISVADPSGRLVSSTMKIRAESSSIATRSHFLAHVDRDSGHAVIGSPVLGQTSGKWSFHLTRRINRPDGTFGGVVSIGLQLGYWQRLLREGHFGDSSMIALVGHDGMARTVFGPGVDGMHRLLREDWGNLAVGNGKDAAPRRHVETLAGGALAGTWAYRDLEGFPLRVLVRVDETTLAAEMAVLRHAYAVGAAVISLLASLFTAVLLVFFSRQRVHAAETVRLAVERRQSEERFRAVFDQAAVGMGLRAVGRRDLPWQQVNRRLCEFLGYSESELLRMPASAVNVPEDADVAAEMDRRIIYGQIMTYTREKQYLRKDGQRVWGLLTVTVLHSPDGRPMQALGIVQDINDRKLAEERVREREEYLNAIIAAEPECVATIAPDGTLLEMNPAGLRMLGAKSIDELRRGSIIRYVAGGHRRSFMELHRRILAGNSGMLEFEAVGVSGNRIWLEIHAAPLRDAKGDITTLLGIARDVTERRLAQQELANERNLLRTVIDSIPDRIRVRDRNLRILLANETWRSARAPGHANVSGLRYEDLAPEDNPGQFRNEDLQVLATGMPSSPRERLFGTPENPRCFVTTKTPLRDDSGRIIGVVAISRDVTDFKRRSLEVEKLNAVLEQRVAERTAQLSIANNELEAFTASVSHDLKSPLRNIDGIAAGMIEDYAGTLDAGGQRTLERIRAVARRMHSLIEDLLRLSRVARAELSLDEVNISEMARNILGDLHREQPERAVGIDIDPDLKVRADAGLMRSALENLLQNAWKFTSGTADAQIKVGSVQRRGVTAYFVKDNGAGFNMEHADRLFGAFQRLHTEREFPGTGVGLATVRRVMRRHGGDAWAEAAVGRGAIFFFTLSGGINTEWNISAEPAADSDHPVSGPVFDATQSRRASLLLVDDDPDALLLAAHALRADGHELLQASDGEQALAILRGRPVDVIVSDFSMPGMNGAQLLAEVAVLQPATLRIILSGQTLNRAMQAGLRKGEIHHFYEKQHSFEPVRACILDWLAPAKRRRQKNS